MPKDFDWYPEAGLVDRKLRVITHNSTETLLPIPAAILGAGRNNRFLRNDRSISDIIIA